MDTLTIILIMIAMAALLLAGAIVVDGHLQRRLERRRAAAENPELEKKGDAADAIINILNRSGEAVRESLKGAKGEDET